MSNPASHGEPFPVPGVAIGHTTDPAARTGCTVILFDRPLVASGEIRGGAPATREFELLEPQRSMPAIDAVVLSGGSAFGLAAADGVMRFLSERGRGFPTTGGPVPIVVGLSLFDLAVGDGGVRPDSDDGYAAASGASASGLLRGPVGAGTGATTGSWRGAESARPGGLGCATRRHGDVVVTALVALNAWGEVLGRDPLPSIPDDLADRLTRGGAVAPADAANTTLGVIVTNAALAKSECAMVARGGHAGLARSLYPAHTPYDGDALVAASTGEVPAPVALVMALADATVADAIVDADASSPA